VLLSTSRYCKIVTAPARVSLGIMQYKPDPRMFPQRYIPSVVLLEGSFTSLYKNRLPPSIAEDKDIAFADSSKNTKMVVISDGDIIRNEVKNGNAAPLGLDRYSRTTYGNKSLIQNIVDYFCDGSGLMTVRDKEYKIRLLDPEIVESGGTKIKVINTSLPILLIMIFGIVKFYLRRRRYQS